MSDTIRTLEQLQALLADNTTGNISAQDIRDFLVSVYNFVNTRDGEGVLTGVSIGVNVAITDGSITLSAGETVDGLDVSELIGHKGAGGASHALATSGSHGFMSPNQFAKLASIESGADVTAENPPKSHSHSAENITSGILDIAQIPSMSALKITSDQFSTARIPNLPASQITSGYFSAARIPNLPASKITSGEFNILRIPNLSANKITSDYFSAARIPNLSANKITSDQFSTERIPILSYGHINSSYFSGIMRWFDINDAQYKFTFRNGLLTSAEYET